MPDIDSRQYKFLTKLMHAPLKIDHLQDSEKEDCKYLLDRGYVEMTKERVLCDTSHGQRYISKPTAYKITPAGRASRYEFKAKFYKWWIPVIISIAAIVLSTCTALHTANISSQQQIYSLEVSEISKE